MSDSTPRRILLIRLSSIGDIVLTTPLLHLLREKFPSCQIDYVTKSRFKTLICHHPAISHVLEFPDDGNWRGLRKMRRAIRAQKYDIVLDLHKNLRSFLLTLFQPIDKIYRLKKYGVRRFLLVKTGLNFYRTIQPVYRRYLDVARALGIGDEAQWSAVHVPAEVVSAVRKQRFDQKTNFERLIVLAPGAGFATKRWPVEKFSELAGHILARGDACCLVGDQNDRALAKTIANAHPKCVDLTGQLSLLETAAVLSLARKVVCNDSGVMHIAEAVGTPVVAIFGSTVRELGFFPQRPDSRVIENTDIRCRPCSHIGRHACPKKHFRCMRSLSAERVFAALAGRWL